MIRSDRHETAEFHGLLSALAVRKQDLQQRHLGVPPVQPVLVGIVEHVKGAAHIHHRMAVALGLGEIACLDICVALPGAQTASCKIFNVVEIGLLGKKSGLDLRLPVPQRLLPLYDQGGPGLEAVQPLVVVFYLFLCLVDLLHELGLQPFQIVAGDGVPDLLQTEAFVHEVTDRLDPAHSLHAVIAVVTGWIYPVRLQQSEALVMPQHPGGHLAGPGCFSYGIQSPVFHVLLLFSVPIIP